MSVSALFPLLFQYVIGGTETAVRFFLKTDFVSFLFFFLPSVIQVKTEDFLNLLRNPLSLLLRSGGIATLFRPVFIFSFFPFFCNCNPFPPLIDPYSPLPPKSFSLWPWQRSAFLLQRRMSVPLPFFAQVPPGSFPYIAKLFLITRPFLCEKDGANPFLNKSMVFIFECVSFFEGKWKTIRTYIIPPPLWTDPPFF